MPHSYNKIWIHAIYATKEREPFIRTEIEHVIYAHMKEQLIESGWLGSLMECRNMCIYYFY